MPRFNSPIRIEQSGSTGFSNFLWHYATPPSTRLEQEVDDVQQVYFFQAGSGNLRNGGVQVSTSFSAAAYIRQATHIAFEVPDANNDDAFSYLNRDYIDDNTPLYYLSVRLFNPQAQAVQANLSLPIRRVLRDRQYTIGGRPRYIFKQNAVVCYIIRGVAGVQATYGFTDEWNTAGLTLASMTGFACRISVPAVSPESPYPIDTWAQLVSQQGSIGLISVGSTGGLNATEDVTLDVRYNPLIVPGLAVRYENEYYRLLRIELLERYRFMRLSLSRASS